jgi:hypothetical protein
MIRRTTSLIALALAVLLVLGTGATAGAASPGQILSDCSRSDTGYLKGTYTKGDLRRALGKVTGDLAEYSGCYDAIRHALAARPANAGDGGGSGSDDGGSGGVDAGGGDTGTGGPTGSGGGASEDDEVVVAGGAPDVTAPPTPAAGSDQPVRLAGATIRPGTIPSISRDSNELPTAMVVLLVLLGVGALGAAGTTIGRRVLARRRV